MTIRDLIKELEKLDLDRHIFLPEKDINGKRIIRKKHLNNGAVFKVVGAKYNDYIYETIELIIDNY